MTTKGKVDDPYLRHLFDGDSLLNVYKQNVTNLSVGAPGPDMLKDCVEMMKESTSHRLEEEEKEGNYYLFQYGITSGLWEFRNELAQFLSRRYGDPVKRENLILTCGASHGLQLLLNTVVSPNGVIFVEEATYMIALDAFKQFPLMKIVTVPMKNDVVDLDALEKIVSDEKHKAEYFLDEQKIFWSMFYTIPIFHNPTGMTLAPEQCKRLVQIARRHSLAVICDDVYNLLHYDSNFPPHRLLYYDDPSDPEYNGGNIISNGTFSKILSPAIRVGWLECNPRVCNIIKPSGIMRSGGAVNNYVSGIVASLLQLRIQDKYLDKLIATYADRMSVLCDILNRYLPSCCTYRRPGGGYFVWIHLPTGIQATHFIEWCQQQYNVSALPGARFSYTGSCDHYMRISISFHSRERIASAGKALCTALLEYIRNHVE